jgi:hypothetical protein
MNYFTTTKHTTAEDLKRQYRRLSKKYHPDKGGSDAAMAAINEEYEILLNNLKNNTLNTEERISIEDALLKIRTVIVQNRQQVVGFVSDKYKGLANAIIDLM